MKKTKLIIAAALKSLLLPIIAHTFAILLADLGVNTADNVGTITVIPQSMELFYLFLLFAASFIFFILNSSAKQKKSESDNKLIILQKAVENSREIIIITDKTGLITYVNCEFTNTYGYSPEEIVGRTTPRILKSGVMKPDKYAALWDTIRSRQIFTGELINKTKSGKLISIDNSIYPIFNGKGEIIGYIALQRDITEKKWSEEALRESEKIARALLNAPDNPAYLIDTVGLILSVNEAAIKELGKYIDDLVGCSYFDSLPANIAEKRRKDIAGVIKSRQLLRFEEEQPNKYLDVTFYPLFNALGEVYRLIIFDVDITEKKIADLELIKLRKAVDTSGEIIFLTDREGIIKYVNPEFTRVYGYTAEEIVGKTTPRILKSGVMQPADYKQFWDTIVSKDVVRGELINKTKSGELITIYGSANPIMDEFDNIVGFLAIQRDISERKAFIEKIQNQNEFLNSVIESLTYPFYVIDAKDFTVKLANSAANIYSLDRYSKCYELTHNLKAPCTGDSHCCPLKEVKLTKAPVTTHHIHYDKDGKARFVEVHAYPIFDNEGEVSQVIEYSFDLPEQLKVQAIIEKLKKDMEEKKMSDTM